MADETSPSALSGRTQVTIDRPDDLRYWTKTRGATETQLKFAMEAVGTEPAKVRDYVCKTEPCTPSPSQPSP